MRTHPEHGYSITTVFDYQFFYEYDEKAIREIFDDILDSELFDEKAWSLHDDMDIVFHFTQGKSDAKQLNTRRIEAQKFIDALNTYPDVSLRCHWLNDDKNAIVFKNFFGVLALKKKVNELFPRPTNRKIENPQEVLDVLEAMESDIQISNNELLVATINPGSRLDQMFKNEDLVTRFIDAAETWQLDFEIWDLEDNENVRKMALPTLSVTQPDTYQVRLAGMKKQLKNMTSTNDSPKVPVITIFDNDYFAGPYTPDALRVALYYLLDDELTDNAAWIIDADVEDEPWTDIEVGELIFDLTWDKSGKITDEARLKMRQTEAGKFVQYLNNIIPCRLVDNSLVFEGFDSKESLRKKTLELFPLPDQSEGQSSEDPAFLPTATMIFDEDFFDVPYFAVEIREVFDDILSKSLFDEEMSRWDKSAWAVTRNGLVFDYTQQEPKAITNELQIAIRQSHAQKFVDSLNCYTVEGEVNPQQLIRCHTKDNTIVFEGLDNKAQLQARVDKLLPLNNKADIDNPQEVMTFLNRLDTDVEFDEEDDIVGEVVGDSDLCKLICLHETICSLEHAGDAFGINFLFRISLEFPVQKVTQPQLFAQRIDAMKKELQAMIDRQSPPAQQAQAVQATSLSQFQQHINKNQGIPFPAEVKKPEPVNTIDGPQNRIPL